MRYRVASEHTARHAETVNAFRNSRGFLFRIQAFQSTMLLLQAKMRYRCGKRFDTFSVSREEKDRFDRGCTER